MDHKHHCRGNVLHAEPARDWSLANWVRLDVMLNGVTCHLYVPASHPLAAVMLGATVEVTAHSHHREP